MNFTRVNLTDTANNPYEDCLKKIPNRFQMVLVASVRARQLSQGHTPKIECKDKATVAALREIAEGVTGLEMLNGIR